MLLIILDHLEMPKVWFYLSFHLFLYVMGFIRAANHTVLKILMIILSAFKNLPIKVSDS